MKFREAIEEDLDQIVAMLADDPIGFVKICTKSCQRVSCAIFFKR